MKAKRLAWGMFAAVFLLTGVLAGCSGGQSSSGGGQTPAASMAADGGSQTGGQEAGNGQAAGGAEEHANAVQFPIVIDHAFGQTVIEKKPERVVTISWANHDVALALGVVPVGFSEANYGVQDESGLLPWTKQKLEELGVTQPNVFRDTDGLDFEAISDAEPDVILAAYSGITREEYELLTQIAPTVAYPKDPWVITWREQIRMNAAGLGIPDKGEQLIQDLEQLLADKVAENPQIKGKKAIFAYLSPADLSSFWIYLPEDPRAGFLGELGMEFPESAAKYVTPDAGFAVQLSAENADALNGADFIVSYGDKALLQALQADPVFGQVPAVKKGAMVLVKDNTPLAAALNPNPLSIQYMLDEYVAMIVEALEKSDV
mgnify:FL=1